MKKVAKVALGVLIAVFIFSGVGMAYSVTVVDTTYYFPGYPIFPTSDEIGDPQVSSMVITINDITKALESVVINETNRQTFDSLFINAAVAPGESYDKWDYYVFGPNYYDGPINPIVPPGGILPNGSLYDISGGYQYVLATVGRIGHPAGIKGISDTWPNPPPPGIANIPMTYDGSKLTYDFKQLQNPIVMDGYVIGYSEWCGNDVILTPEPSSLLLLGLGMLGVGLFRRRK